MSLKKCFRHCFCCQKRLYFMFVALTSLVLVSFYMMVNNEKTLRSTNVPPWIKRLSLIENIENKNYSSSLDQLDTWISPDGLFSPKCNLSEVTEALRNAKIHGVELLKLQTSYKWQIILEGGHRAVYKPMLLPKVKRPEACNVGCEHPEYEVAAFTVNRLLDLNNMPLTTGRKVIWSIDIAPVASQDLLDSVNITEDGDVCFEWTCLHKTFSTRFCFDNGEILGSLVYWLERPVKTFKSKHHNSYYHDYHPYSPNKIFRSKLPGDQSFCKEFRDKPPYTDDKWFLHVIDMAVVDYFMNNFDQKHTYIAGDDGQPYANIMLDFGHSFCQAKDILLGAAVYQCCKIRNQTYEALVRLSGSLRTKFEELTAGDPLFPILLDVQFSEMEQRFKQLMTLIKFCFLFHGMEDVIMD
ncbi:hypothetical protein CHS0354_006573 [Potamilus streckersoni]|uniref:FAM20 C-terminal domain-containing protein n=1 Tax=Potamilus streckersoni TaxID=2493646 RepID=A0AAE0RLR5_9BIVA|nr:hypothetical protein CHS0354_006573 [Potamilus streckersoni]